MQILGLLLILINVGAIVGPIAGVVVIYQGNLQDLVAPPAVQNLVTGTINTLTFSSSNPPSPSSPQNSGGSTTANFAMPQYVSSSYDVAARTASVVLNLTNPLNITLTINQVSADVKCHAHAFFLGHAEIPSAVDIPPAQTVDITVVFAWTEAAQEHILSAHQGESKINVDLVNITVNVSGITIETPSTYNVDIPLY